jgi:hypothetical protein
MATKFKFNPTTGNLDMVNEPTVVAGTGFKVDKFTLSATDITNKYVILQEVPNSTSDISLDIVGGVMQSYGDDFELLSDDGGKRLSWNGLGLDGVLEEGEQLVITYN